VELLVRGDANLMASVLQGAGEIEQRCEVAKTGNTAHEHPHTNVSSRMVRRSAALHLVHVDVEDVAVGPHKPRQAQANVTVPAPR